MNTVSRLLICLLLAGLLVTAPLTAPATAAESRPASPIPFPWFRLAPVGTWYITFLVEGTPPGFNLPGLITFHQDWTFTAVDGGDFGALPDLPFNQTDQQGVWRWSGGREFVATGMILSFKRGEGVDGQLDNISRTRINIDVRRGLGRVYGSRLAGFLVLPGYVLLPGSVYHSAGHEHSC